MSSQIGSFSFIAMQGGMDLGIGEKLEDITRANVDGIAYRKVGKRGGPFDVITTVDVTSSSSAKSTLQGYEALQGTLVTLQDDVGSSHSGIAVLDVQQVGSNRRLANAVGGISGGSILLRARWRLQATETT